MLSARLADNTRQGRADRLYIVHRRSHLGPVDPSFRALSGSLKFTVRRHKFNEDFLSAGHLRGTGVVGGRVSRLLGLLGRACLLWGGSRISHEKGIKSKLSGDEVYYTNSFMLLVTNMLCSNFHCRRCLSLIHFSYQIAGGGGRQWHFARRAL